MDPNTLKGNWDAVKGKIKEQWGNLSDDDIREIDGKKDKLIGKLEQKYGHTKDQAQKMVEEFEKFFS